MYVWQQEFNKQHLFMFICMLATIGKLKMAISFCKLLAYHIDIHCFSSKLNAFTKWRFQVMGSFGANYLLNLSLKFSNEIESHYFIKLLFDLIKNACNIFLMPQRSFCFLFLQDLTNRFNPFSNVRLFN